MRLRFLFWNTHKSDLTSRIASIARSQSIDVIVLAEYDSSISALLQTLQSRTGDSYNSIPSYTSKTVLIARLPLRCIEERYNDVSGWLTVREILPDSAQSLLVASVHLPDKSRYASEDQAHAARTVAQSIQTSEEDAGHTRTVLVGDFNMNPFEPGLVMADGFNAVMTRDLARVNSRTVRRRTYPVFYNPMWAFFGDGTPGPAGTYYYKEQTPSNHFWHIYDQVMVRPSILHSLQRVEILSHDGDQTLLTRTGRPSRSAASDHLPILFDLHL